MSKIWAFCAAGLLAWAALSAGAQAQPIRHETAGTPSSLGATSELVSSTDGDKIRFGTPSAVPLGYYSMCVSHPSLCRVRDGRLAVTVDGSVEMTGATMGRLAAVNASVNASVHPALSEEWTPGRPVGDCKDFAMTKRQRLLESGWPSSAVPVAMVRTRRGESHLVLVARTSRGDFVLDNLTDAIVPWSRTSYSWEKIQSPTDGLGWRSL